MDTGVSFLATEGLGKKSLPKHQPFIEDKKLWSRSLLGGHGHLDSTHLKTTRRWSRPWMATATSFLS